MRNIIAEYIWQDAIGNFRSKSMTVPTSTYLNENEIINNLDLYPSWSYDGSSTGQASGNDSEIILKPVKIFKNPFRNKMLSGVFNKNLGWFQNNLLQTVLVLCETFHPDGTPTKINTRAKAREIFTKYHNLKPWYGIEQEFFIMQVDSSNHTTNKNLLPLGFQKDVVPEPQGQYYCSVGSHNSFGRNIVELAYSLCLFTGIKISGINAEVAPGQWELQVGPCLGIEAGDQLSITRYILHRVSEIYNVSINIEAKPLEGDWNGSGCHINFSTEAMRETGGLQHILEAIEKLKKKHSEHIVLMGKDNQKRMTGKHETADYNTFNFGVANRGASVRIPRKVNFEGKGYFEDRRPAANMDPYLVTSIMLETIGEGLEIESTETA